jgi:ribosomal protein S18 acetylase RimI-like enzyme
MNGAAVADRIGAQFSLPVELRERGYALRPEVEDDIPFLKQLYASTRADELNALAAMWTADQRQAFLDQQFAAQRHHYHTQIDDCRFAVIEERAAPVGRLYLEDRVTQLHIVDVALLPAKRGRGIGGIVLTALIDAAHRAGKGVGIFVEPSNPALNLYRRLGFTEIRQTPFYLEMEVVPGPVATQLNAAS